MSDIRNTNRNVSDDEIDIYDVFRRMGKALNHGFNKLGRGLLISSVFIVRRWLPLGLSILAALILTYYLKSTSPLFYSSDLVLRNNLVRLDKKSLRNNSGTTSDMISKINELHVFCVEKNTAALSKALLIEPQAVKLIIDISAFWIIDLGKDGIPDFVDYKGNHNIYDTVNIRMPNRFDVRIKISSTLNLNQVRDGLIHFIESDSLNQQRNRLRLRQNEEMLSRLNYDIQQLDSLQKVKYFEEPRRFQSGGQIVLMQEQKTQLLYGDIHALYAEKQLLESERDLYRGVVTTLSGFTFSNTRENDVLYYGKNIIPTFFLITLLILVILANRAKFKELFKKY